jgi:hypothetical protein
MRSRRETIAPSGATADGRAEILAMLRRRGLAARAAGGGGLLVPRGRRRADRFYELLRHYAFRLLLRDVLIHRDGFALADLLKYCSRDAARRYLAALRAARLVRPAGRGRYRLAAPGVRSFGDTLEWVVVAALERELGIPALRNLRIEGLTGGGDFDVLAAAEGRLIYVETKCAPPRHIDQRQVAAFFDRVAALRPHLAIFLEDTTLRMKDKLAGMFELELARRLGPDPPPLVRVAREVFTVGDRLFLTNTAPDLVAALGLCLARFFAADPACLPAAVGVRS